MNKWINYIKQKWCNAIAPLLTSDIWWYVLWRQVIDVLGYVIHLFCVVPQTSHFIHSSWYQGSQLTRKFVLRSFTISLVFKPHLENRDLDIMIKIMTRITLDVVGEFTILWINFREDLFSRMRKIRKNKSSRNTNFWIRENNNQY